MADLFCTWNLEPCCVQEKGDIGSFLEHSVQRKHLLKKLSIKQELTTSVSKIVMIVLRFIFSLTTYLFTINTFYKDNLFVKRFVISRKK